jgi:hypothetical protein
MKRAREEEEHQYALTADGRLVYAPTEPRDSTTKYFCDCPERHPLKLVAPSGRVDKRGFTAYFAHLGESSCTPGGESMKHRAAKFKLREIAPILSFTAGRCSMCNWVDEFQSDGHSVRLEVRSEDKQFIYDCLLVDALGTPVFALEVYNTHKSSQRKIDTTRLKLGFAEFSADDILQQTDGRLENLEVGNCLDCPMCKERADKQNHILAQSRKGPVQSDEIVLPREYVCGRLDCLTCKEYSKDPLVKLCELAPAFNFVLTECQGCGWPARFHSKGHTVRVEEGGRCLLIDSVGTAVLELAVSPSDLKSDLCLAVFTKGDVMASNYGRLRNVRRLLTADCVKCRDEKVGAARPGLWYYGLESIPGRRLEAATKRIPV